MNVHRCEGCTKLFYPHGPIDGVPPLRCDAVIITIDDPTWHLLELAAQRRSEATKGFRDRGGVEDQDRYRRTLLGACGEWAVAKALGLSFDAKPFGLDVGGYNVRTRGRHEYALIVQDFDVRDHPTVPFLLVTASPSWRAMIIRGWLTPQECRPEWRQTYGGYREAFFAPQADLHDLRRLPERGGARQPETFDDVPDDALT